jgi:hypothetical protein
MEAPQWHIALNGRRKVTQRYLSARVRQSECASL